MIHYKFEHNWADALSDCTANSSCIFNEIAQQTESNLPPDQLAKFIIRVALSQLHHERALTGLFKALQHQHTISPFLASQHHCFKVKSVSSEGHYRVNISPIYLLGPEYPHTYEENTGESLQPDAIIGFICSDERPGEPSQFSLGIDAGIVFKEAKLAHNRMLDVSIESVYEGILVTLNCETQTTTTLVSLEPLNTNSTLPQSDTTLTDNSSIQWAA